VKFVFGDFFSTNIEKIQMWLKSDKNTGHSTLIPRYVPTADGSTTTIIPMCKDFPKT
jgi:hypothetical protein